ncbi:TetR/AcrR family transcriptional regulator [Yinghuangia seranimata]|uniref:TetR/AcrR family transcriptional regulator n=1 Tax=Yinghuangia seranimata TaxID=408067 RepID=UPI00248AD9E7|nr:TetR/AcrR family transcriptional regulator C-terminal domain-containing protein [Yinghuangia seranimata]MDI2124674.1 TetR/AcrR family transcriptional regulator C-terminal domain-containing protein [Yinghuangia seranimata]
MGEVKRRPGRPPLINRRKIINAALELDAAGRALSMQAVADRLGVPRGTLYHHVADREEMVALVAVARLEEAFDEAWMPPRDADWRTWVSAFAHVMRDALIAHGTPVDHVLLEGVTGARQLAQVERVLEAMVRDGFTPAPAMQALGVIAEIVTANARTVFVLRAQGTESHDAFLALIRDSADHPMPLLAAGAVEHPDQDAQFAVSLEVALAGIAAVLLDGRPTT